LQAGSLLTLIDWQGGTFYALVAQVGQPALLASVSDRLLQAGAGG